MSFAFYRKGLTFSIAYPRRFTSVRHAARLLLLYALWMCWRSLATHKSIIKSRAYRHVRVFWFWRNAIHFLFPSDNEFYTVVVFNQITIPSRKLIKPGHKNESTNYLKVFLYNRRVLLHDAHSNTKIT